MCKFSIIIPNYNKGDYIKECLESVFNQDIQKEKFEVIVIDDGSTDNSVNIIKEFPVKFFQTNRKGAGGARNVGLDHTNGEYILFLDSDDFISNNHILTKLDNLAKDQDVIFLSYVKNEFGNITVQNEERNSIAEKIEKTKIKDKSFTTDIMVEILEENLILNIEAYTSFSNRAFLKSLSYINRIFSTQLDIGEEYEKLKQCRQINIVDKVEINLEKSPIFVNFFASFKEILTKKESIEFIRLDTI